MYKNTNVILQLRNSRLYFQIHINFNDNNNFKSAVQAMSTLIGYSQIQLQVQ